MIYFLKKNFAHNKFFRGISIATLNILFYSKTIKSWFEKHIFNPYEIDGNESADYAYAQIKKITEHLDISNKTILEIGPGGNYYLACLLLKNGAKKIFVIDNENHHFFSDRELSIYRKLYPKSIKNKEVNPEKIKVLQYKKDGRIPLPQESCDIIYSNAVLEHVYAPEDLLIDCQRLLKINGRMFHQIDFRDHIFDQKSLFFLKIPTTIFDILYKNTGMWVNRFRYSKWISVFSSLKKMKTLINQKQCDEIYITDKTLRDHRITSALFILEKYVS